ncbi:MAG: hypothetical protein ACRCWI_02245 [Brevinema sp.]
MNINPTYKVILFSLLIAILIVITCIFIPFKIENNTVQLNTLDTLKKFLDSTAITIISFLYPIIVSSYIYERIGETYIKYN